ncbi:DNA damage-inducible protein DinB OS=Streptomyces antimycoticus OX=68175 GN=SANT12839_054040 PE=4 SV=1 [Streptomyces antimycoticus]
MTTSTTSRCALLCWQFDLTWSLFEYHLERLDAGDFLWEPAAHCWTVRRGADGAWVPDWAETEPDPVPVPTIGWLEPGISAGGGV